MARASTNPRGRGQGREVWWSSWPVVILVGLGALSMVTTGVLPLLVYALLAGPGNLSSGTDLAPEAGPGIGIRILYAGIGVALLAIPGFVIWSARRRLLGFLLLGLIAAFVVMCWGLAVLGIL